MEREGGSVGGGWRGKEQMRLTATFILNNVRTTSKVYGEDLDEWMSG